MDDRDGAERGANEDTAAGKSSHGSGSGRNYRPDEGNKRRDRSDVFAVEYIGQTAQDRG